MTLRAVARVDTGTIERNCARLAALAPLCAVVKAEGYGHGAVEAARAARRGGAAWLAVATAVEARELRAAGIDGPLLVLGALSREETEVAVAAQADVVAWHPAFAERVHGRTGIHVKLDTGLGRLGTRSVDEADATIAAAGDSLTGLMTHFATSDDDPAFMREQLERFLTWTGQHPGVMRHAANSAAALGAPDTRLDLVRCGIAIYGMDPFHEDPFAHGLEPALTLASHVAALKLCAPGESTGYGRRFVAEEETWVATLPIGYADGVRRALTNNADVLIGGRRYPVAGTVSMDNITVDLGPGHDPPVALGDEAVLIGRQGDERILAEEVARRMGTINYEVTCGIGPRVAREHA